MCDCTNEAVCPVCDKVGAETVAEMSRYVKMFIEARFPEGLEGQMLEIISDIVVDAFRDGSYWSEVQAEKDRLRNKLLDNARMAHSS